jgi:hypothetical protein
VPGDGAADTDGMTSPYVAIPAQSLPRPAAWRIAVVVLACLAAPPAAAVAAFVAAIVWSGCFISCDAGGGDHLAGAGLWLLAGALLVLGPVLAWLLLRSGRAVVAAVGGVIATLLTGALRVGVN